MSQKNLEEFEKKIGIGFNDKNLLKQVFVHRSYLNENVGFDLDHNERLEFLGDAVLELIVTEFLYNQYKNPEGELTNWRSALVRGEALSEIANSLGIEEFLYLSKGEQKSGGKARQIILANTFEALVGAIFLDQGIDITKKFISKVLLTKVPSVIKDKLYLDPKSHLQELSQAQTGLTPVYKILTQYGPDHAKSFTVGVFIGDKFKSEGSGSSKRAAEESAASSALERWTELNN